VIAILVIIGVLTVVGVLVISVIEAEHMEDGRPDMISGILEKNKNNNTGK
jgi:hypothetical protein